MSEWKDNKELAEWLVKEIDPKIIVDIGTHKGYSANVFAKNSNGHVYTIDPDKQFDTLEENVTFVEMSSKEAYHKWGNKGSIDILHIDGDHSFETVMEDLTSWANLLNHDGVILMHDIANVSVAGFGPVKVFIANTMPYKACYFKGCGLGILTFNQELMEKILNKFMDDIIAAPTLCQYWMEKLIGVIEDAIEDNPTLEMK